jgi:hypothetical protein
VLRKGKLLANEAPLEPLGHALFRFGGDAFSPDVAEFLQVEDGMALLLKENGRDYWRVEVP